MVQFRAIPGWEVGRNQVLNNIHYPGYAKGQAKLFLECSADVYYDIHQRNKQEAALHIAGHHIHKFTQLEQFYFHN